MLDDISTRENSQPVHSALPNPQLSPRRTEDILVGGGKAWKKTLQNLASGPEMLIHIIKLTGKTL